MITEPKRKHYVAAIPSWLSMALSEANAPLSAAKSFSELSTIVSDTDVCFYYHYLLKLNFYTDDAFDDMENIAFCEENFNWVMSHQKLIAETERDFALSFDRNRDDLTTNSVPSVIRKVPFKPVADSNMLFLVGVETGMDYNRHKFYADCMEVLGTQMLPTFAEKFTVFKRYTNS